MKMAGKKNLALVELILVILFFALSSMILVQVFVKARSMSDISQASTLGLVEAQDWIEQLKAAPGEAGRILSAAKGWTAEEAGANECRYTAAYGADMMPIVTGADREVGGTGGSAGTDGDARTETDLTAAGTNADTELPGEAGMYEMQITVSEEPEAAGTLYQIQVTIDRIVDEERIIELSTARYVSERQKEAP